MSVLGENSKAYLLKVVVVRLTSFARWKKTGTLYCPASCSCPAATALDTDPNSAATRSWSMRFLVTVSPVAGSTWLSPVATLILLPSRPPWELMSSTASLTPFRPAVP